MLLTPLAIYVQYLVENMAAIIQKNSTTYKSSHFLTLPYKKGIIYTTK